MGQKPPRVEEISNCLVPIPRNLFGSTLVLGETGMVPQTVTGRGTGEFDSQKRTGNVEERSSLMANERRKHFPGRSIASKSIFSGLADVAVTYGGLQTLFLEKAGNLFGERYTPMLAPGATKGQGRITLPLLLEARHEE